MYVNTVKMAPYDSLSKSRGKETQKREWRGWREN